MHNVLRMSRKAFTVAVVAATIAWSVGLAALVAPLTVNAAASGDLVRGSLPAVYYVGANGRRYVFPNEKTYKTWYSDFSTVQVVTDAELAAMPIGGNATYKPGVKMVKIQTDPKVYAVDANGTLRWVQTEALATELYGASWNTMIEDVPDAFFVNYTIGSDIAAAADFVVADVSAAATSINVDKNISASSSASLSVCASSSMPVGSTLPKGATGVNMLKFDVVNGGADAMTVNSLTVHRSGAGQTADFSYVYLYDGNVRLTTGRTVNSSTGDSAFNGLSISVPAHGTKTLWIAADLATTANSGNVHMLSLTDLKYGTTSVSGLPVSGPQFTMSNASSGTLTITKQGAVPLSNVMAGGLEQLIGKFQVAAGTGEDVSLERITLFQGGAVSTANITNLKLKQASTTVATAAGYDSNDRVTFVLGTPFLLEKGANRTFDVYADISAGARTGTTETILTYVDSTTDVMGVGQTYGYGANVDIASFGTYDGTSCALGADNCSSTRIEGSTLTITFNGPAAADVAVAANDVELYSFTMAAAANLEVRNLRMAITATDGDVGVDVNDLYDSTDAENNYSDIKLVNATTGVTVAGPLSLSYSAAADDITQTLTFTETFTLAAGSSETYKVTADVRNSADNDADRVQINLSAFQSSDIRNLDNSTYLSTTTDIVPNAGINGNPFTVHAPTLTMAAASSPVAQTYIKGSSNVALGGYTFTANDAADIYVTSIALTGYIDTNDESGTCTIAADGDGGLQGMEDAACASVATVVLTAGLWNGDTQVGTTKSPSASSAVSTGGVLTFNNLGLVIPAGESVSLTLKGNISGALATATLTDLINFRIAATTDVSATDLSGNSVTKSGVPQGSTMTVADKGSISATLAPDDSDTEAGIVVASTSNVVLGKYKFTALNEELKVTKARFHVSTSSDDSISSLTLYDGSTVVGGPVAMQTSGNVDFSGVNFVIPKDSSKVLTVKANLNAVGTGAAASGSNLALSLMNTASTFEARGTGSGSSTLISTLTSQVDGRAKIIRKSKPTVSLMALPQTVLTSGDQSIMRFSVAADAAGDISFKKLTFTSNVTSNVTLAVTSNSSVRRVGDASNLAGLGVASGAACSAGTADACTITVYLTNEEVISAGSSRTYDLRLTVGGALAVGDSISSTLNGESSASVVTGFIATRTSVFTVGGTAFEADDVYTITNIGAAPKAIDGVGVTAVTTANAIVDAINADATLYFSAVSTGTTGVVYMYPKSTATWAQAMATITVATTDVGGVADNQTVSPVTTPVTMYEIDTVNDGALTTDVYTATSEDADSHSFIWSDNSATAHSDTAFFVDTLAASMTGSLDFTNGSYVKILTTDTQTMSK